MLYARARPHLIQEPEPLLRERQRQRRSCRGVGTIGGKQALGRPSTRNANSATVGASKSARKGSSTANVGANARNDLRGQERVPPQLEEVVVDAHCAQAQHRAPDLRQLAFHRRPRQHVLL